MSVAQLPMYYRIEQKLLEQIQAGQLLPGQQLPTEAELVERFNVSRITAKRALDNLVQQGMAFRHQGKGTFVASQKVREITGFGSFADDMQSRGRKASSQLLDFKVMIPSADIAKRLKLTEGKEVFCIRHLRSADHEPVVIETAYVPCAICPSLSADILAKAPLYTVLQEECDITPTWAEADIEARRASAQEAGLLGVKAGHVVMVAKRITFTPNYEAIEFVESVFNGESYSFYTGRHRIG